MKKLLRLKLQSKEDPAKFKYLTTSDYKIGDTVRFKWQKEWTVTKILKPVDR